MLKKFQKSRKITRTTWNYECNILNLTTNVFSYKSNLFRSLTRSDSWYLYIWLLIKYWYLFEAIKLGYNASFTEKKPTNTQSVIIILLSSKNYCSETSFILLGSDNPILTGARAGVMYDGLQHYSTPLPILIPTAITYYTNGAYPSNSQPRRGSSADSNGIAKRIDYCSSIRRVPSSRNRQCRRQFYHTSHYEYKGQSLYVCVCLCYLLLHAGTVELFSILKYTMIELLISSTSSPELTHRYLGIRAILNR